MPRSRAAPLNDPAGVVQRGSTVPGFFFLASIIAIFSGAQLFALGIIGEYLARMHFRSMERPAYVVHETTWTTSSGAAQRTDLLRRHQRPAQR